MGADCHRHYHGGGCCCSIDFDDCCCFDFDCDSECLEDHCWLRKALWAILAVSVVVGTVAFTVYLVLRPAKPSFYLKSATVRGFNLSLSSNSLSTEMQVTVASHNSNARIGIYYDRIDAFASYHDQQITAAFSVQPFYQGHDDRNLWSPYLAGDAVPVEPYLCRALQQDEAAGFLLLYVRVDARIRWKVGLWTSGNYHLDVTCPVVFSFASTTDPGDPPLQFHSCTGCSATV